MAVQRSSWESRCLRTFRALLALYPGAFRDEYQRELVLVFSERYRDADGAWDRAQLSMEAAIGIFVEAPKEHGRMIRQDLHYALRMLRRHALVTTIIVLTLGLGIGANTAMFSLMNAVLLRTLPVPDADHMFMVNIGSRTASPQSARLSGPMFERLHDAAPNGVSVAAMSRGIARAYTRIDGESDATPASLQLVSSNFFEALHVSPVLGRTLSSPANALLADTHAAIISHGYWSRRFGASPDAVGRTLTINSVAFTVTGVAPRQFAGVWLESPVDIWVPLAAQSDLKYSQDYSADGADTQRPWLQQPQIWWLHAVVRARPDRIASLQGVFQTSVADLTVRDTTLTLDSFAHGFSGFRQQFSTPLLALVVMAVLLMLIASASVANLLLARAATRQREIATRMALGAGRARLVHQMLTESVLLVAMATVAAILFANWVGDALVRTVTATTEGPSPFAAALDVRVLGFTAAIALGSVVIFGLVPAWRTTRRDVISGLGSARGVVGNVAGRPARVIVILQVALSLVLVVGTGLMVRSFQKLLALDLGFERSHLLSVGLDQRLAGTSNLDQLHDRVLRAVGTVPSVEEAALAMCGLQSGCRAREGDIVIEGYVPRTDEDISFVVNAVTPGYFSTVGTRLLAGRAFTDRDDATAPKVAVVNMALAKKYFGGGEQALGRRFGQSSPDVAIVGIVEDARSLSVREPAVPAAFFPLVQRGSVVRSLEVRTKGSPEQAVMAVRRTLATAAPELLIERVDSMDERVRHGLARERLVLFLTSGFGTLALGLAAIGLFGVLSFSVARRTSEFGVRMALGASRSQIRWGVVREAQWLVLCGVLLGVPVALLGGHLASALFFGVSPFDVPTLLITALMLAGVALVCAVVPAMRASRVDPIVALRQD